MSFARSLAEGFHRPRVLASLFYLLYYGAAGALMPYLNLYYQTIGMDNQRIGLLAAVPTVMTLLAAPFWSALADALGLHKILLPLTMTGTLLPILLLTQAASFPALVLLVLLTMFFLAPVIPLADSAVLALLGPARHAYGLLRAWGAVGWGLSAWGGGLIAERWGLGASFVVFVGLMAIASRVAARLPGEHVAIRRESYLASLKALSTNRAWLGFLTAIFMVGVSFAMLNNYFVLYLKGLGAGESLFGLSVAAASLSELPVFFLSPWFLRRFKPQGLLLVAFLALVVRSLAYSTIVDPRWAVAAQLLHGLSFSAMWAAGVTYAGQIAPPGLGASAQSALGATFFGVASATGALIGAWLFDLIGPVLMFRAASLVALIGLVVFGWNEWRAARSAGAGPGPSSGVE